ncbi:IS1634 family transposase [Magnetococcales bacterium HHB-1]
MYIDRVPNRNSPPAVLLRESYREDGKSKKRTLANLTPLPDEAIELVKASLKGRKFIPADGGFEVERTLPHGHVAAVTGTMRKLGFSRLLGRGPSREKNLVMAMIAGRILRPASKLATSRFWHSNTLAETYGVEDADKEELYQALDWLLERKEKIEEGLSKRHLSDGSQVLYDLTSTYVEGKKCSLAQYGYSRDKRSDRMQIEFGLVTDQEGRPIAVEAFEGNTSDSATLGDQVKTLTKRFGLKDIIVVGDRGMITQSRIDQDLKPNDLSWVTTLRHASIRKLGEGPLQLSLFDEKNLAEIQSDNYPGERLIACRNPTLAFEIARKRTELLGLTQQGLEKVAERVANGRLKECGAIGRQAEQALKRYKMTRFFTLDIRNGHFSFVRNEAAIAQETELDGIYVIRTPVDEERLDGPETVRQYKGLSKVERAFRHIKTDGLQVRPIFHHLEDRVRAHVFLCMLAYYVEWEMRKRLSSLLFADEESSERKDPVTLKEPSENAKRKTATRRSESGFGLHSFRSLLDDLSTLAKNWFSLIPEAKEPVLFTRLTNPTPFQKEVFRLLDLSVNCTQ